MARGDDDLAYDFGACVVIAETDKAIGVKRPEDSSEEDFDETPFWVPKSVLHDDSEVWKKGDEGDLVVKHWWAEKNGHA